VKLRRWEAKSLSIFTSSGAIKCTLWREHGKEGQEDGKKKTVREIASGFDKTW